jgi:hypothetical protein
MSTKRFKAEFLELLTGEGVDVLTHTINKPHEIVDHVNLGVRGVYSDYYFNWESVQKKVGIPHDRASITRKNHDMTVRGSGN